MARLPLIGPDSTDPLIEPVFSYFSSRGREAPELYRVLGNSPALLKAWTDFAWPLRHVPSVPRGLRELAIVRVAQLTGATYEWEAHAPAAVQFGIPQSVLHRLDRWPEIDGLGEPEREVLKFTDEITLDFEVQDDTFAALDRRWSSEQMVELTLTVAFYSCVSRVLRALRVGE